MRGFAIILGSAAMLIAGSAQAGVSGFYGTGVDVAQGNESGLTKAYQLAWNEARKLHLAFRRLAGRAIQWSAWRLCCVPPGICRRR